MAYNIFERWPFTSFQNLNLDWILSNMKEAVDKANEASETVGQFDDRISKNTQDIADLTEDINNKPEPMMIDVNTNLQVLYKTLPITGGEIYNAMVINRYLPFVRYRDEIYMVDSIFTDSAARDVIRFALLYAPDLGSTYIKRLDIIFTGNTAAYSIKTISGGESADDVLEIRVTANGSTYQTNTAYSQISAAAARGYFIYLRLVDGSDNTLFTTGLMSFNNNAYKFINPDSFLTGGQMYAIVINSNNEVYQLIGPQYLTTDAFAEYLPRLLPVVSSADNGKFLRVVDGAWEAVSDENVQKNTLLNLLVPILRQGLYGTDQQAAISALETALGGNPAIQAFLISNNLTNVSNTNEATAVNSGTSYTATLTPAEGMEMQTVIVTMGGVDITSTAYNSSTGAINIASVTGNIVITAVAESLIETIVPQMTNGAYVQQNGTVSRSDTYGYTQKIPVSEGDKVYGDMDSEHGRTGSLAARFLCAYDSNESVVSSEGSNVSVVYSANSPLVVPSGIKSYVFSIDVVRYHDIVVYVDKSERTGA